MPESPLLVPVHTTESVLLVTDRWGVPPSDPDERVRRYLEPDAGLDAVVADLDWEDLDTFLVLPFDRPPPEDARGLSLLLEYEQTLAPNDARPIVDQLDPFLSGIVAVATSVAAIDGARFSVEIGAHCCHGLDFRILLPLTAASATTRLRSLVHAELGNPSQPSAHERLRGHARVRLAIA